MIEAHLTADVHLFWKLLMCMQHVSNGTDSATLVLKAKCRDTVFTGLLSMEVNVKSALRLHFISVINTCILMQLPSQKLKWLLIEKSILPAPETKSMVPYF